MSRTFVQTLREYGLQLPADIQHVRLDSAEQPTQLLYTPGVTRTLTPEEIEIVHRAVRRHAVGRRLLGKGLQGKGL